METHFFIAFSFIIFISLIIYTILYTAFGYKFLNVSNFIKLVHKHNFSGVLLLLILGLIFFVILIFINSSFYLDFLDKVAPKKSSLGSIGDLFNGLVTPTVSLITVIYLYKAFMQQYEANQMFYDSELERSLKEDVQFLRGNNDYVKDLEKNMKDKDFEQLTEYLGSVHSLELRRVIYIMSIFEQLFQKLELKKNKKINLIYLETEINNILYSLYFPYLKPVYRILANYLITSLAEVTKNVDYSKVEIEFLMRFSNLYDLMKHINEDKLFSINVTQTKESLK